MDYEKQIMALSSENEFLHLQLKDFQNELAKRFDEINIMGEINDNTALLRSKIDSNYFEVEQLLYNNLKNIEKTECVEILKEELEINLLKEIKGRQKDQQSLQELISIKTNIGILADELNEAAFLYKKIQQLKSILVETNSTLHLKQIENEDLINEILTLKKTIKTMQPKPLR